MSLCDVVGLDATVSSFILPRWHNIFIEDIRILFSLSLTLTPPLEDFRCKCFFLGKMSRVAVLVVMVMTATALCGIGITLYEAYIPGVVSAVQCHVVAQKWSTNGRRHYVGVQTDEVDESTQWIEARPEVFISYYGRRTCYYCSLRRLAQLSFAHGNCWTMKMPYRSVCVICFGASLFFRRRWRQIFGRRQKFN